MNTWNKELAFASLIAIVLLSPACSDICVEKTTSLSKALHAVPAVSDPRLNHDLRFLTQYLAEDPVTQESLATIASHGKIRAVCIVQQLILPFGVSKRGLWPPGASETTRREDLAAMRHDLLAIFETESGVGFVTNCELLESGGTIPFLGGYDLKVTSVYLDRKDMPAPLTIRNWPPVHDTFDLNETRDGCPVNRVIYCADGRLETHMFFGQDFPLVLLRLRNYRVQEIWKELNRGKKKQSRFISPKGRIEIQGPFRS
jgi:hypothetical protein